MTAIRVFTCDQCGRPKPCRCTNMDDQASQYSGAGARATAAANKAFDMAGIIAHQGRVIDALRDLLATGGVSLETFKTDMRPQARIVRDGNMYNVSRVSLKGLGS